MERYNSSPEIFANCLIENMHFANGGAEYAQQEVRNAWVETRGEAHLFQCAKYGCPIIVDAGIVRNASRCELVRNGEKDVPVELR